MSTIKNNHIRFLVESRDDVLREKYVDNLNELTSSEFDKLKEFDIPPYNYLNWIIKQYLKYKDKYDVITVFDKYMPLFFKYKESFPEKDLNQYTLGDFIRTTKYIDAKEINKFLSDSGKFIMKSGTKKLYIILSRFASCKYGANTQWCISGRHDNRWNMYKEDLFFFVIDSNPMKLNEDKIAVDVIFDDSVIMQDKNNYKIDKIKYYNSVDNEIRYKLPPSFKRYIYSLVKNKKKINSILAVKKTFDKAETNVRRNNRETKSLEKNVNYYLLSHVEIPRNLIDTDEVDLRNNNEVMSLLNLKSCNKLILTNCTSLTSLGDLEYVHDFADFRGCKNITQYNKLKHINKCYVNKETNVEMIKHLRLLTDKIIKL